MTPEIEKTLDLALEALRSAAAELYRASSYCNTYEVLGNTNDAIAAIKQARSAPYVASPRAQETGLTWERFDALEAEIATLQTEWQASLKEIERLKAAAPVQEPDEWPTGCPECGMDSGCDCDSGTWNPPAAPVQEPDHGNELLTIAYMSGLHDGKKKRAWVGLTDEEQDEIAAYHGLDCMAYETAFRTIEAKLKEKNT